MLSGLSYIGYQRAASGGATFTGKQASTGADLPGTFHSASLDDVETAARLAGHAFPAFRDLPGQERGAFLRTIAANIEALGQTLTDRAMAESGLPEARIKGETARTCGQLRLFAGMVEEGSWVDARIDHADPARTPLPKPDTRSMLRPLGPVVVFGASNFPLAYSTAGGDTASALAAGCPVIVKAHAAHPGTAGLVAGAVVEAARSHNLPDGVFSMLYDAGLDVGTALVRHPLVQAVGFTGSRAGGTALAKAAAERPQPIPVYAEMSSVNPVFVLTGALAERGAALGSALAASVTAGVGQFCTCPGLVIYDRNSHIQPFQQALQSALATALPGTMLNAGIRTNYLSKRAALAGHEGVSTLVELESPGSSGGAGLYATTAKAVLADIGLTGEVFGPATLLIAADGPDEILELARSLEGQLTATVHAVASDLPLQKDLMAILETKAGRLLGAGVPTGLEVNQSIVHGGPWPATSDGRTTSVGGAAILRFARHVCWQDCGDALLPPALQESNPLKLPRLVNGARQG
ncbi:MAG: aldehyde dehydrogenase (NADP(+)) [Verrucomicrobiaceae bacterium]|nr:MAG: aldehyde dehydrogenase (NADP(+)) [Verrucomicrobiaceae bacterium]